MKTILPYSDVFNMIVDKQMPKDNIVYRRMHYCILHTIGGAKLAFNVLTRELVELSQSEFDLLNKTNIALSGLAIPLIEKYFLVPVEFDEKQLNDQVLSVAKSLSNKKHIVSYTILTTTDCNARCFYCYQLGCNRINMSLQTANEVVDFIEKNCGGNKIKINWFGGEPLYNSEPIDFICSELNRRGIEFYSNMVSNAYLFDEKIVKRAKNDWNLKKIQITLDGTEKIYNSRKKYIYKDNDSPYRTVLNNIDLLLNNGLFPVVRLNMDLDNKDDLYELVDELYIRFGSKEAFNIYACPIFDYNENSFKNTPEYLSKMSYEFFKFNEYLETRFNWFSKSIKKTIKINSCMADDDGAVMILPDGSIGKCDNYVDKYIIGDIRNGITDRKLQNSLKETLPRKEKCRTCPLLPQCRILKICSHDAIDDCEYYIKRRSMEGLEKSIEKEYNEFKNRMGSNEM